MRIDIEQFSGIAPKINTSVLAMNAAQAAENCRLDRGDITPLLGLTSVIATLPKVGTVKSLFRLPHTSDETLYWLHWLTETDAVLGTNTGDTTQRVYYCDGVKPKWTNFTLATGGGSNYPVTSYDLGMPTPSAAPTTAITTPGSDQTLAKVARIYVYTWVSSYGEESAPSPASAKLNVVLGDVVTVSGIASAPGGNYSMQYKRVYRSEVASDGSIAFYYVGQIAAAATSLVDNVTDVNEALATSDYSPPPDTIKGFTTMPNGIIAGFSGSDLWFCEPYLPYAWPDKYRITTDFPIVGLASFGQSLLVTTTGTAYIVTGIDPAVMSMESLAGTRGCVSKRSIVATGDGALYASNDGLVAIGQGGRLLTEEEYTQSDWLALNPSALIGSWHEGRYVGFSGSTGIIIDKAGKITTVSGITPSSLYIDSLSNKLYTVTAGQTLSRFDSGSALTARWKSKKIVTGKGFKPACARVEADAYNVTFKIWADGVLKHTQTVTNDNVFWLPSGIVASYLEIEVSGTTKIQKVSIASSPQELKRGR